MDGAGLSTNLVSQQGCDFSGARFDIFIDVNDFILDPEINYFKCLETQVMEQIQMDNILKRKAHVNQAMGTLFEERRDRRKGPSKDKQGT